MITVLVFYFRMDQNLFPILITVIDIAISESKKKKKDSYRIKERIFSYLTLLHILVVRC